MDNHKETILSIGVAHTLAQRAAFAEDYASMREIWETVKNDPSLVGDTNDYHNYSVVVSKVDDYLTAYEIVKRGLGQFPYNTDLLADAIYYGSNCNKFSECEEHLRTLLTRPRASWTWRAFSFIIDYLKDRWDWEDEKGKIVAGLSTALKVSKDYQRFLPSEERGYLAEYELHQSLAKVALEDNDIDTSKKHRDLALQILKDTIDDGEYAAVQCSLKYVDALFSQQQFEEVISVCDKALQFGQPSASARLGYFMYLSAQSREILLYKKGEPYDEDEVKLIYKEYIAALADTGTSYKQNIDRRVKILSARSGVKIPDTLSFSMTDR